MTSIHSVRLALSLWVGLSCAALFPVEAKGEDYDSLPGRKALAVASDPVLDAKSARLQAEGVSQAQPSDVAAAMNALAACGQRRAQLGVDGQCEVVRLNGERIQTGAEIRKRLPRDGHPLFLWQIDGERARVYLAGSVHALKTTLYPLPAPFEAAFARSDTLVVEVDTVSANPAALQRSMLAYTLLPTGVTLDEVIAPDTLRTLNSYLTEQAIPPASLAMLKPVMIATQLSVMRLMALGYLPDFGLEQHFIGRRGDRAIVELESIDQQLDVLTSPTMALQEQLLLDTLTQMPELGTILTDLIVAWFAGDDVELRRLFDEQAGQSDAYRAFMEQLLGERNRAMTNRIEEFLAGQRTSFVLVGAAHLTGADGIIALLRARGHRARRILSNETL